MKDEVKRLGVDYDGVFRTYAQLADLRYRVGSAEQGMSTYAQPNTPYGFGRIGKAVKNISVWHPASWLRPVFETVPATRDIAAGRPLWAGKAQDIAVREAYRPMAPKPNLGTPIPPAYRTVLGLPASTIANAEYTMGGGPPTLEAYPGQYEYRQAQPLGMARPMQGTQYPQLPAETGRATGYATTRPPSGAGTTERIAPNRFAKPEVLPPSPKGFTVGPNGEIVRNPRALLPGAQESVPPPPPTETPVYPHGSAHRGEGAKAPTNYAPASQFRGPKEKPFTATELLQMHQTEAELVKASKGAKSEQEAAEYRKAIAMARKAAGVKK